MTHRPNEVIIDTIKAVLRRSVKRRDGLTMAAQAELDRNTVDAIWAEVKDWKNTAQMTSGMDQAFALITSEFPAGLKSFYVKMTEEGFPPEAALLFTRDLLAHLMRKKKEE